MLQRRDRRQRYGEVALNIGDTIRAVASGLGVIRNQTPLKTEQRAVGVHVLMMAVGGLAHRLSVWLLRDLALWNWHLTSFR